MATKGGGKPQVTGYRYYMSMLMSLCRGPIDQIVAIKIGGQLAWPGNFNGSQGQGNPLQIAVDGIHNNPDTPFDQLINAGVPGLQTTIDNNGVFQINADGIFGGDQKEGGVQGGIIANFGQTFQDIHTAYPWNAIVQKMAAAGAGAMGDLRGIVTLFFHHGHLCSNNPYPKPWTFRVRRSIRGWDTASNNAWYPEEVVIPLTGADGSHIAAMNPAHIIYQCLTDRIWGRGLPASALDETSFISAANVLCVEKFGLCMKWSRETSLDGFIQLVINHIGAAMYVDRETGLLVLKLLRFDYDPSALPAFDYSSGLLSVKEDVSTAPDNSHSEIIVNWTDPIEGQPAQTRVQNLAGTMATQSIASTTVDYIGIPTAELAARVGLRDLALQAPGIKRYTLVLDRRGRKITPGGVFRLSVPSRGIASTVLRAGKVEEGATDQPTITVTAIQDTVGLETTTYVAPPVSTWQPPDNSATPATIRRMDEISYRDAVRVLPAASLALLTNDLSAIAVGAQAPTGLATDFLLATHASGEAFVLYGPWAWTPTGIIGTAIGAYTTTVTLASGSRLSAATVGGIAYIDNEAVEVISFDPATVSLTIGRGCIDTIPAPHPSGTRIWFGEYTWAGDLREYTIGETITVEVLTRTNTKSLAIGEAPSNNITLIGRQARPYPPGDFKINGTPFATVTATEGDVVLTWAHRDRITQADHVLVHSDASTGPEAGTTYTVRVYNSTTLLRTVTGITGTTWTYDSTMDTADGNLPNLTFELESVRDGLASWQKYHILVAHASEGMGGGGGETGVGFDFNFDNNFDAGTGTGLPSLSITADQASAAEGNTGTTPFTFTVTRTGDLSGASSASWAVTGAANAADFVGGVLPSGTVSFTAGQAARTITVNVQGDTTSESNESFTVTLSAPSGASIVAATASSTIINDEATFPVLDIAADDASKNEGDSGTTAFTFTVTRSGDLSSTSSASWAVTGTANAADFVGGVLPSGTVSFAIGDTTKTITVNVQGDTAFETSESFTVTLSSPSGASLGTSTASSTITNDDASVLSIAADDASKNEGDSGTTAFTFTVTRTGDTSGSASASWAVTSSSADGTDFVGGSLPSGTVSFSTGETTKTITVNVQGDTTVEGDETFTVTLSSPSGATLGTATASSTITNDDVSSYTGNGDVVTGFNFWVGLRAFSDSVASPGTNKSIEVRRTTDSATQDVLILSTGDIDVASANTFAGVDCTATGSTSGSSTTIALTSASSTPHVGDIVTGAGVVQPCYVVTVGSFSGGAGNITVNAAQTLSSVSLSLQVALYASKLYDQVGGLTLAQATTSKQALFVPELKNGKPGLVFLGSALQTYTGTLAASVSQPWSTTAVVARTGGFTSFQAYLGGGAAAFLGWSSSTNTFDSSAGGDVTKAGSDSAAHSVQSNLQGSGSNSFVVVDGSAGSTGSGGFSAFSTGVTIGSFFSGSYMTGHFFSAGLRTGAINSTQYAALHTNDSAYYATP